MFEALRKRYLSLSSGEEHPAPAAFGEGNRWDGITPIDARKISLSSISQSLFSIIEDEGLLGKAKRSLGIEIF